MAHTFQEENGEEVIRIIVPGFIALSVRSQFITGRISPQNKASLLSYLTISVIYGALVLPFVDPAWLKESRLAWFVLVFIGPIFLGLLLGINIQKDFVRRFLNRFGLYPAHAIPTAWDWKFNGMAEQWVLVTLKDGTRFAGFYGARSFVSSNPDERDMFIQWIYDIDEDGTWTPPKSERGVLIAAGEIRTIEFWPYNPQGETNAQESYICGSASVQQTEEKRPSGRFLSRLSTCGDRAVSKKTAHQSAKSRHRRKEITSWADSCLLPIAVGCRGPDAAPSNLTGFGKSPISLAGIEALAEMSRTACFPRGETAWNFHVLNGFRPTSLPPWTR